MVWLILIYLVINPFFLIINMDLRQAQELCFQISSMILILSGVFFNQKKLPVSKLNSAYCMLALWVCAVLLLKKMGFPIFLNLFLGIGAYFTVIRAITIEDIPKIFRGLVYITLFALVYLGLQYAGYDLRDQRVLNVPNAVPDCAFFGIKAAYGMYIAETIPVIACFNWILAPLMLFPLALSYSTGAMLAGHSALMFFLWFRKRVLFWIFLVPTVLGTLFFIVKVDSPMGMYGTRIPMWGIVIQDIFRRPLGHGLDSFRNDSEIGAVRYFKYSFDNTTVRAVKKEDGWMLTKQVSQEFIDVASKGSALDWWDHPHNEFIWLGYETGFPGLIGLGYILWLMWQRFRKSTKNAYAVTSAGMILALLISSMTQFPFHLARIGHLVPIILGIFYITTGDEGEKTI